MWGFTGQLLLLQKFPSAGGGSMLVSMQTSHLSFQTNVVKLPLVLTPISPLFNFSCYGPKSQSVSHFTSVQVIKYSWGWKEIVHKYFVSETFNSVSLTAACVAVMSSVAECESLPKYTLMSHVFPDSSQSLNFDANMLSFLWNVLPEDNPALEFYSYLIHCQMLWGGYRI